MNAAKHPSAAQKSLAAGSLERVLEPFAFAARLEVAHDAVAQQVEHVRNGDQCRRAFARDGPHHFRSVRRPLENDGSAEQRWNKQRHELAEDVAERNQRDKAQRMKPALVLAVRLDPALKRLEVSQKIAMSQDHTARLSGRARSEEDLRNVVARDRLIGEGLVERRVRLAQVMLSDRDEWLPGGAS